MDANKLLAKKKLARTPCRVEVLKTLLTSDTALSEQEIRERLAFEFDRTTVYRTLRNFLSLDIIHSVAVENNNLRYAITKQENCCSQNINIHFYCSHCGGVYCMERKNFLPPPLPEKFVVHHYELLINGMCDKCHT